MNNKLVSLLFLSLISNTEYAEAVHNMAKSKVEVSSMNKSLISALEQTNLDLNAVESMKTKEEESNNKEESESDSESESEESSKSEENTQT